MNNTDLAYKREREFDFAAANALRCGYRIESRTTTQLVLATGGKANHILHLLLTVFTVGLWLPMWFIFGCTAKTRYLIYYFDDNNTLRHYYT